MGFVDRLRMNGIYGNSLQPPDLNMGADMSGILSQIIPFLQNQRNQDFNEQNNVLPIKPRLQDIGHNIINPQGPSKINTGPMLINGMPPADFYDLEERKREFDQSEKLKRDTLSFKKEDATTDNNLAKEKVDITADKNKLDAENKAKRTAIYDFKAKNPGMKLSIQKGGNFFAFDPISGNSHDTGISSGTMSEEDKQDLIGEQRIDQINHQGINQLQNIGARIVGQKEIAAMNNSARLGDIAARNASKNNSSSINFNKPELPTQTRVRQVNTARELINTKPELAPFIKFDQNGSFSIVAPGTSFTGSKTGPTKEQFDEINKIIYGKTPTYKTEDKVTVPNNKPAVDDTKVIVEKDGKKSYLPKEQLAEALKQGYKEVKK